MTSFKTNSLHAIIKGKSEGTILPEQVLKQKVPCCQNRCKNRRYHTARTGVKTEGTILPEQV
jgi:hypothetical protein